jgi:hypothetical protein
MLFAQGPRIISSSVRQAIASKHASRSDAGDQNLLARLGALGLRKLCEEFMSHTFELMLM